MTVLSCLWVFFSMRTCYSEKLNTGFHRLIKYFNIEGFLKSMKIDSATGKLLFEFYYFL